jgi:hypothetical protein
MCNLPCLPFELCSSLRDDDCDGLTDCQDPDCFGDAHCATCEPYEVDCGNYDDDDCDGRIDCADEDCAYDPACGGQGSCQPQQILTCGSNVSATNDAPGSTTVVDAYGCGISGESGPEMTYALEVQSPRQITVRMTPSSGDLDLFLLEDQGQGCDPQSCLQQSVAGGTSTESVSTYAMPGQVYYVVVDGWSGTVSSYQIRVTCQSAGGP